jgi:hypothetical protein
LRILISLLLIFNVILLKLNKVVSMPGLAATSGMVCASGGVLLVEEESNEVQ